MSRSTRLSLALATLGLTLVACGKEPVTIPTLRLSAADQAVCQRVVDVLPDKLGGQGRRHTQPAEAYGGAWGDPPIVLQCGADVPAELNEIIGHFPKFWSEAGHLMTQTLYESAKLDRKTIELILLSLLAGRLWETGVKVHTASALEHGATPDEIRGALLMSIAVFSTSSAVQGLHWAEPVLKQWEATHNVRA